MAPLTVGLTGGIGAGKSTVAELLREHGAEAVVGDELGREALVSVPGLLDRIRERFGADLFSEEGILNRRELARRVFSDSRHVRWLTDRTFPYIHAAWRKRIVSTEHDVIVLDAALIFEWGIEREFDRVVVVTAPETAVLDRAYSGRRLSREELQERLRAQVSVREKASQAHTVIENSGSVADLQRKIDALWRSWQEMILEKMKAKRE